MMGDLRSPRAIRCKAVLFAVAGCASALLLLAGAPSVRTAFLVVVHGWAWCRLYYFAFHVVERWLGGGRYRGLGHALATAFHARNARPH